MPEAAPSGSPDRVIIGVGNPLRGDDAVGLAVIDALRDCAPDSARLAKSDGNPTQLMSLWAEADSVVVVDATRSGRPPGTVCRFESADVADAGLRVSGHLVGVSEAVSLAAALGELPDRLVAVGIEVASVELGRDLSSAVAAAVPVAAEMALAELHQMGAPNA